METIKIRRIKGDNGMIPISVEERFQVIGGKDLSRDAAMRTIGEFERRDDILREIVKVAHEAEDAGDFVLWVQKTLKEWKD